MHEAWRRSYVRSEGAVYMNEQMPRRSEPAQEGRDRTGGKRTNAPPTRARPRREGPSGGGDGLTPNTRPKEPRGRLNVVGRLRTH
jgi:hypothetical protein